MEKILKCESTGYAFPADFNWTCPFCDTENRAFQLPRKAVAQYTKQELQDACQHCSWEKSYATKTNH